MFAHQIFPAVGDKPIDSFKPAEIGTFINDMRAEKLNERTVAEDKYQILYRAIPWCPTRPPSPVGASSGSRRASTTPPPPGTVSRRGRGEIRAGGCGAHRETGRHQHLNGAGRSRRLRAQPASPVRERRDPEVGQADRDDIPCRRADDRCEADVAGAIRSQLAAIVMLNASRIVNSTKPASRCNRPPAPRSPGIKRCCSTRLQDRVRHRQAAWALTTPSSFPDIRRTSPTCRSPRWGFPVSVD